MVFALLDKIVIHRYHNYSLRLLKINEYTRNLKFEIQSEISRA